MTQHRVTTEYHPVWLVYNPAPGTTWPVREQDGMTPHGFIGHPDDDKFVIGQVVREGGFVECRLFPKPISIESEDPDLETFEVLHKGKHSPARAKWIIQYGFKCREDAEVEAMRVALTVPEGTSTGTTPKGAKKSSPSKRSDKITNEGEVA